MNEFLSMDQVFIRKITQIVLENMADENFGVDELVKKAGMSRSSIHRKLKVIKKHSITQFIREIRLQESMEMLRQNVATVSEIAFRVGFSSPSYFNKCFHDFYGKTPNEIRKKESENQLNSEVENTSKTISAHRQMPVKAEQKIRMRLTSRFLFFTLLLISILVSLIFPLNSSLFRRLIPAKDHIYKDYDKSIVVLPFKNISDDPDNKYFSDGIMEDVLIRLFQISNLRVISRTTAEQFQGSLFTAPEIAGKLGVNYVLEGSVQRYENKARVLVQLIDARHDQPIWSEKYDRELTDIFTIQSQIAEQIANELRVVLSVKEIEKIEKVSTTNIQAYNYYLQGRYFLNRRNKAGVIKSLEYFKKAISEDPDYALAIAGLANGHKSLADWGIVPMLEGYNKAKNLALRSMEIDNNLADPHSTLGYILGYSEFKWEAARKELARATELEPYNANAHLYYAQFLNTTGQTDEARKEINKALMLDPLSMSILRKSAGYYIEEGNFEAAVKELRKMEEIDPLDLERNWLYEEIFIRKGDGSKVVEVLKPIFLSDPKTVKYAEQLDIILKKGGLQGVLKSMIDLFLKDPNPIILGTYYALTDQKDEALDWLEKAFDLRSSDRGNNYPDYICDIYQNWQLKKLRSEPRFHALINKMGLLDYYHELTGSERVPAKLKK